MRIRRWVRVGGVVFGAMAITALWAGPANSSPANPEGAVAQGTIDCLARPLERVPPGTKIADGPPAGWTHLVFKTRQRLAAGAVDDLPDFSKMLAEFLFTAILAHVAPEDPQKADSYRIEKIAIGVGTDIDGEHVIVTSGTQAQLGANLGPFKKVILSRAEEHLGKIQQVARSDTFMVVDAPTVMYRKGGHENVVFRYLFLVHPPNGALASIVWPIDLDSEGRYRTVCGPAVLVKPNLVSAVPLHVEGKEIYLGIPSAKAFATTRLPMGTAFELSAGVRPIACQQQLTPGAARQLEAQLRQKIAFPEAR